MREILFRGKRTDNGEWVHGYYVAANHSWHKHGVHRDWIITAACSNGGWFALHGRQTVVAGTVGQYTGLKDKNGVKIFEGDIVTQPVCKYTVEFDGGAFFLIPIPTHNPYDCPHQLIGFGAMFEVIGNIHDNPELLKET